MHAEAAYLFRHALVRDAAYELQPPGERAGLHALAADVMGHVFAADLDPVAHEIAAHLRLGGADIEREREFTQRGARYAHASYNHSVAIQLLERLVVIGEPRQAAEAHQRLYGTYRGYRNDIAGARRHAFALLRLARSESMPEWVALALNYLAGLEGKQRAMSLYRRSYRQAKRVEAWLPAALAIGNMGAIYAQELAHRRAERMFRSSIRLNRRANNLVGVGFFLGSLAGQLRQQGDLTAAFQASKEGVAILEGIRAKRYLPTAWGHHAAVLERLDRLEECEQLLAKAEQMAEEIQLQHEWWKLKVHRAMVALERRKPDEAKRHWRGARNWLVENGRHRDLEEARTDLCNTGARLKLLPPDAWE